MTDKTPKLLADALGAIGSAQEFVAGITLDAYALDKMRRSASNASWKSWVKHARS
jgi:hypothetical protein